MRTIGILIYLVLFCVESQAQLPAPVATQASTVTANSFTANWNSVSGALNYGLDVSTVSTFATFVSGYNNAQVGSGGSQPQSASVTGLASNTFYYYRVRAQNSGGPSANSGVIGVQPALLSGPMAAAAPSVANNSV